MVKLTIEKCTINNCQYQEDVGCICMLKDWISSTDEICADKCNYFPVKLKGKGRSEQCEVYLYGDKTIKVDRDGAEGLPRGVHPPGVGGVDFGSSPNLATDHTICELCRPSECDGRILRLEKIHSCGTGFELSAAWALSSAPSLGVSMAVIGSKSAVG